MSRSLLHRAAATAAALALVALPAAGCGSSGRSGADADPAAAVPAAAPLYLEAVVRPSGKLKADATAAARKILGTQDPGQAIAAMIDRDGARDGIHFRRDVDPWLGNRVGVAVTRLRSGAHADAVLVAAVRDQGKAKAFIAARPRAAKRTYRGVSYEVRPGDRAIGLVGDTVVAGTEAGLKASIDATKGDALSEAGAFKDARKAVPGDGLAFAYADPGRLLDAAAAAASGTRSVQVDAVKSLLGATGLRAVGAELQPSGDALRADAALLGLKPSPGHGNAAAAAAAVPADAWLSLGIGDVGGTVQRLLAQVSRGGGIANVDPQLLLGQLRAQLGLDVQRDLLSWMGDAALFVRGEEASGLSGALVVHSKDPAASRRAVGKLRTLLGRLGITPAALAVPGGGAGLRLRLGALPRPLEIAASGDRFVVAMGHPALADALRGGATLGSTAAYRTAAGLLHGARPGLFVDVPRLAGLAGLAGRLAAGSGRHVLIRQPRGLRLQAFGPAVAGLTARDGSRHVLAVVALR